MHKSNFFSALSRKEVLLDKYHQGFTIVELVVVVVVIAILATITIVSYNGISQRASNTATIGAANQLVKLFTAYTNANNTYPTSDGPDYTIICLTITSGCATNAGPQNGDNLLTENLQTIGTLPGAVPSAGSDRYGVMYQYVSTRQVDGINQPAILFFYLFGTNQDCKLAGVTQTLDSSDIGTQLVSSSNTYSNGSANGKTLCVVSIKGPSI